MPELPEVEATATYLREKLVDLSINDVRVSWHRTISGTTPQAFSMQLVGLRFHDVRRRGKYVVFELRNDCGTAPPTFLLGHMRMSGSFDVLAPGIGEDKHDRVVVVLDNGKELRFNDPRKFGRLYLTSTLADVVGKLGPEPLDPEFSAPILHGLLSKVRGRIKAVLLDQRRVAGLGNIYVDEALWAAFIHPERPACSLSTLESERLFIAVQEILREAIRHSGTDFGDGVVYGGMYTPRVYGRDGEPCSRCGSLIRRIVVGQRGTHVCAKCQRAPRKLRAVRPIR